MFYEYIWGGYLASKIIVCCHGLDIFWENFKKDDKVMINFEKNYKNDHSGCVKTLDQQILDSLWIVTQSIYTLFWESTSVWEKLIFLRLQIMMEPYICWKSNWSFLLNTTKYVIKIWWLLNKKIICHFLNYIDHCSQVLSSLLCLLWDNI